MLTFSSKVVFDMLINVVVSDLHDTVAFGRYKCFNFWSRWISGFFFSVELIFPSQVVFGMLIPMVASDFRTTVLSALQMCDTIQTFVPLDSSPAKEVSEQKGVAKGRWGRLSEYRTCTFPKQKVRDFDMT